MEKIKDFISHFVKIEAEAWTKNELGNLDAFNQTITELYSLAIEELDEAFGIFKENELRHYDNPMKCNPRHIFKLSRYKNLQYGDIWVAYASMKNPNHQTPGGLSEGYIMSEINNKFKITGLMSVALDELYMEPTEWKASMYNPSNIDIHDLGKLIQTERYEQPEDDGFSLEDYMEDK